MLRPVFAIVLGLVTLFLGIAAASLVMFYLPDPGSAPSIYDDFNWSSTSNGFWHVNPFGGHAIIKDGTLTLRGDTIELDRRIQTDPVKTAVVMKVRGLSFRRFSFGLGVYHAGTMGVEFDDDGMKCGRGTNYGFQIDIMKAWTKPPVGRWFYLTVSVVNPYPPPKPIPANDDNLKPAIIRCSMFDSSGKLLVTDVASNPPPNTHYVGLDEAYMRTWDTNNAYQIDWMYAGPTSGIPDRSKLRGPI
jgi:hypothetical protein